MPKVENKKSCLVLPSMASQHNWYHKTPLLRQQMSGTKIPQIFIKYENLQPGRSFKIRGIGNLISSRTFNGTIASHIFSSSGGNAGMAAAVASQQLNLPCTVVVPTSTKQRMIDKIRGSGAEVIIKGSHWKEADDYLQKNFLKKSLDKEAGARPIYVHPFDDPKIWEGHSTMISEIISDLHERNVSIENFKGIVCSVGGGGLFNGIMEGLENYGLADKVPVIAVETKGCDVFNASLHARKPVILENIRSVATSLGSSYIPQSVFERAERYATKSIVLDDKDVVQTCLKYADDFGQIIEPACGASIHLGYHPDILEDLLGRLSKDDVVVIIACGGSATTLDDLKSAYHKILMA